MAVHGSLLTMPLADLLGWVKTTHRSGVLTVTRDGSEWELTLEAGRVTGYFGPELRDNLGYVIVTSGLLTEIDLRRALQAQRGHGGSLQKALLDLGLLSREQLQECLTELARESIYDLFIELPGEFVFSELASNALDLGLDDTVEHLPLDLDVNRLLMEGARRIDEWRQVRERFVRDDVLVEIVDAKLPPVETLGVRVRRILASLNAGQSVSDICLELRAPVPSVLRALAELEKIGAVIIREGPADGARPANAGRVAELLEQASVMQGAGQFDEAISLIEAAVRLHPDSGEARGALRECLEGQIRELYQALPPVKIPYLIVDELRLSRLRLRSEERFLVDRLEAGMDIGSLIMISSMSERETLKTLKKLLHGSIIKLR